MHVCVSGHKNLKGFTSRVDLYSAQVNGADHDMQGKTALHWAAECPQVIIVQ